MSVSRDESRLRGSPGGQRTYKQFALVAVIAPAVLDLRWDSQWLQLGTVEGGRLGRARARVNARLPCWFETSLPSLCTHSRIAFTCGDS